MYPPNPAEVAMQRIKNTVKTAAVTTRDDKATDNNTPAPGTVGELLIPDQVKDFG